MALLFVWFVCAAVAAVEGSLFLAIDASQQKLVLLRQSSSTGEAEVLSEGGSIGPIELHRGTDGLYAGQFRTEGTLDIARYTGSDTRYTASLDSSDVHLLLESASAGLRVGSETVRSLVRVGEEYHMEGFATSMVFWLDGSVSSQQDFVATFQLHDELHAAESSGLFHVNFTVHDEDDGNHTSTPDVTGRSWVTTLLVEYGDGTAMNFSQFEAMYAKEFPYLARTEVVVGDSGHGHDHRFWRRSGNENLTVPDGCLLARPLFDTYDRNADERLSESELVGVLTVFSQMMAEGCQGLSSAPVKSVICPVSVASSAEAWGYAFLSGVLISLLNVLVGLLRWLRGDASDALWKVLGGVGLGAGMGVSLLFVFPFVTVLESILLAFGLDGSGIHSGHHLDYLWPLIVAAVVTIACQVAHQVLQSESASGPALTHSIPSFFHASLDEWKDGVALKGVESEGETPRRTIPAGVVFAVLSESFLELGFGLLIGGAWTSSLRLGLLLSSAFGIFLFLLKIGVFSALQMWSISASLSLVASFAPSVVLFVGIIAGVASPHSSADAARYVLAIALALLLYVTLVFVCPLLVRVRGLKLSLAIVFCTLLSFGLCLIVVTVGPLGSTVASLCNTT